MRPGALSASALAKKEQGLAVLDGFREQVKLDGVRRLMHHQTRQVRSRLGEPVVFRAQFTNPYQQTCAFRLRIANVGATVLGGAMRHQGWLTGTLHRTRPKAITVACEWFATRAPFGTAGARSWRTPTSSPGPLPSTLTRSAGTPTTPAESKQASGRAWCRSIPRLSSAMRSVPCSS